MEKPVLFALASLFVIIAVKKYSPDYSVVASLIAGAGILMFSVEYAIPVMEVMKEFSRTADISFYNLGILVKSVACAYIAQFSSDICKDAGENDLATKIETSAKIIIGAMSLPVMRSLFEYLREMISRI